MEKTKQKEQPVVSAKIEFVAVTPWGWGSAESPAIAVSKVQSLLTYSGTTPKKGSKEWKKAQNRINLWMVREDEWDRLESYAPANKDGNVGILLHGWVNPEWQLEAYDHMNKAVKEWAANP